MTSSPHAKPDETIHPSPPPQPPPQPLRRRRRTTTTTTPLTACRRSPRLHRRTISKKTEWSHYDITHEILSRLSTKSLARFYCVCKGWQRTISTPFFLKTLIHKRGIKSTTGFVVQDKFSTSHYIPVGDNSMNLKPILFRSLPRDNIIIASCNGLICYRNNTSPESESESTVCVSNLLNNHFIKLPSLDITTDSETSIALGCVENFAKFKLVRVVQKIRGSDQLGFGFQLYSSETGEWRVTNNSSYIAAPFLVMNNRSICIGNVLYWLTYDKHFFTYDKKVLVFDVEKELARLIRGPIKRFDHMSYHMIGESEGSLHYVLATKDLGVRVWCLESYSDVNWTLKYTISFDKIYGNFLRHFHAFKCRLCERESDILIPLGFKDSILLLKLCRDVIEYDIRTDKMAWSCPFKDLNLPCFYPAPSTGVFPFQLLG